MAQVETLRWIHVLVLLQLSVGSFYGQKAPPTPEKSFSVSADPRLRAELPPVPSRASTLDPNTVYALPDLVNIAERNNPETRIVWERAKERAAELGVSRSSLYPTIAAVASASVNQYSLFFGRFYHEDTTLFPASLHLSYTVLDFGARGAGIDLAKANLLAADFSFNDAHRRIIFGVTDAYYRLLDAMSQDDAAKATLTDAQTLQQAVEARLANGFATLPDVLEARAATAQARYELASIHGLVAIRRGALATAMGMSPATQFRVRNVSNAPIPPTIEEPFETIMGRALAQRPDLLAQVAQIRAADASIGQARSAWYPALSFSGDWGHSNGIGQEKGDPLTVHSSIYPYQLQMRLNWNLFDGGARQNESARASEQRAQAQAQASASGDRIEDEIWTSYVNLSTARSQQEAADALLQAADQSYSLAMEAFQGGVRTFIDVSSAQKDLARARTAQVSARVQLLRSIADLAFRAGDPIQAAQH